MSTASKKFLRCVNISPVVSASPIIRSSSSAAHRSCVNPSRIRNVGIGAICIIFTVVLLTATFRLINGHVNPVTRFVSKSFCVMLIMSVVSKMDGKEVRVGR